MEKSNLLRASGGENSKRLVRARGAPRKAGALEPAVIEDGGGGQPGDAEDVITCVRHPGNPERHVCDAFGCNCGLSGKFVWTTPTFYGRMLQKFPSASQLRFKQGFRV